MQTDRVKSVLANLGRSTLRGVRKCPKCGTLNGTRGASCKNKACDVVFKESGEKKKQSMEVCKLDTGTSTMVYSVRVRDKGPDYRGFVQLPVSSPEMDVSEPNYLTQVSALCFVDSCQRLFNSSILKCHEKDEPPSVGTCAHIRSALRCCANAQPLLVNNQILNSMNISSQMKESVWQLTSETPGPVVQRVSKTIMAVKCKVTTKHPLGFLHVTFYPSSKLREIHFSCSCITNKSKGATLDGSKNCVHYYACIAAFASDPKLAEEFSQFLDKEVTLRACQSITAVDEDESENALASILNSTMSHCEVEVEVLAEASNFLSKDLILTEGITQDLEVIDDLSSVVDVRALVPGGTITIEEAQIASVSLASQPLSPNTKRKARSRRLKRENEEFLKRKMKRDAKYYKVPDEKIDPSTVQQSFIEWLASVTERINQTMHFQFNGKPDPLIFHTPHTFFDCFMERFLAPSIGVRRRRLPNRVTTYTRKATPPLGTFYNYTWHISNILHAKAIFDTPLVVLNVTRSFVQNPDGTYEDFDPTMDEELQQYPKKEGEPTIRPMELKTYLKIGKTSPEQEKPSLLSIDWTPNILPISKVGELKITFEYGHTHPVS